MGLSEIDDSDTEPSEEEEQKSPEKEEKMTYEQAAQILGVAEDEEEQPLEHWRVAQVTCVPGTGTRSPCRPPLSSSERRRY